MTKTLISIGAVQQRKYFTNKRTRYKRAAQRRRIKEIIDSIPGAKEALGQADTIAWQVCSFTGGKLNILEQHTQGLTSGPEAVSMKFKELESVHTEKYRDMLVTSTANDTQNENVGDQQTTQAEQGGQEEQQETLTEFADKAAASANSGGIAAEATTAMAGITALIGQDAKIYLVADDDATIPALTHLGGVGGGSFQAQTDVADNRAPYHFPEGVRTLKQLNCKACVARCVFVYLRMLRGSGLPARRTSTCTR